MVKRKNYNIVQRKRLLRSCNLNPRVLLTRLSEKDIARYTTSVRNSCNQFMPYPNETFIKEEPIDENAVFTEYRQYQVTYQEIHSTVKIEPIDMDLVKTEPIDMYENTIVSSTYTNYYGTFNCKICYQVFNNYEDFIVHKNLAHKDSLQYACQYCDEKFGLNAHLNNHLVVHVNHLRMNNTLLALPSVAQSSSKSDSTIIQKKKYIREVTNVEPQNTTQLNNYKCSNCSFITDSKLKLSRHKNSCYTSEKHSSHKNDNSFSCELCLNSYVNQSSLNGHMRYHSLRGDMISKRALRKKGVYIKSIKKSKEKPKPKEKKKFFCNVCDKQFVVPKRLEKHLQLHKSVKSVNNKQGSIGKSKKSKNISNKIVKFSVKFGMPDAKNNKKIQQKNLKPFQCPHCENYYSSKRSLADHTKHFHVYTTITPLLKHKHNKTANF